MSGFVEILMSFEKTHSQKPLILMQSSEDCCQVICPPGSGVVSGLTTAADACQSGISLAANGEL